MAHPLAQSQAPVWRSKGVSLRFLPFDFLFQSFNHVRQDYHRTRGFVGEFFLPFVDRCRDWPGRGLPKGVQCRTSLLYNRRGRKSASEMIFLRFFEDRNPPKECVWNNKSFFPTVPVFHFFWAEKFQKNLWNCMKLMNSS